MRAFVIAWKVSRFLPVWFIRVCAGTGAWVAWLTHGRGVRRLEDNLNRVTGFEGRTLRKLSRRSMASTARYYAEILELPRLKGAVIDVRVRMTGHEVPKAALEDPGRMIPVLGHSGNWDLVGAFTCRKLAPITTVAEVLEPRKVFEEFVAFRESLGMTIIGHEGSSTFRKLIHAAKERGGVLPLLADRDMSGRGIPVQMWGHTVRVAPGPAALAITTNTPLFPLAVHYERLRGKARRAAKSKWGTVMDFGPVVAVPSGPKDEAVRAMTQVWASYIADGVAEHPEDWHMIERFGWVE